MDNNKQIVYVKQRPKKSNTLLILIVIVIILIFLLYKGYEYYNQIKAEEELKKIQEKEKEEKSKVEAEEKSKIEGTPKKYFSLTDIENCLQGQNIVWANNYDSNKIGVAARNRLQSCLGIQINYVDYQYKDGKKYIQNIGSFAKDLGLDKWNLLYYSVSLTVGNYKPLIKDLKNHFAKQGYSNVLFYQK